MPIWSWAWCKNQADLSSSSILMLTIFSVETWGQWHVSSIWIKTPVCRAGDRPQPSLLCRTLRNGSSQPQPVGWAVSMRACAQPWGRAGSPSHTGPRRELVWAAPRTVTRCSTGANSPHLRLLLSKPGGGFFSRSLMGDVSISSNWVLLQNKMPFKNQCSSVCSFSLSPLSQWSRHGAELQAACDSWVTTGNRAHLQGAKTWSSPGGGTENHLL